MSEKKKCEECKYFLGELFRSVNPNIGYCDNKKSPYYKKEVERNRESCEDFE